MYRSGFNNLVTSPAQFEVQHDTRATERRHREIARAGLAEQRLAHSHRSFSTDYEAGFEQGVIEYLTRGGTTSPPLLPPRQYWTVRKRIGSEHGAAHEWLNGAADGREYAATSGARELAIVPSSVRMEEKLPDGQHLIEVEELPPTSERSKKTKLGLDQTGRANLARPRFSASP